MGMMNKDPLSQKNTTLAANICLCKVDATRTMEFVAREASQIMGGASYVLGKKVDRVYRDVRALAIYGGSEEIMLDVSLRLGLKTQYNDKNNIPYLFNIETMIAPKQYYTENHLKFRKKMSDFVERE